MIDPRHPIVQLVQRDKRYKLEAYLFVFEALNYAQSVMGMGSEEPSEKEVKSRRGRRKGESSGEPSEARHLTGQQLCEATRLFALDQYGYMAKCVLNSWGIHSTSDFGEIVYNLIEIEQMRKTENDRREDFDDVFDFDKALQKAFKIPVPKPKQR